MRKKVRTATFNGRKYKVDLDRDIEGLTDVYKKERTIMLWSDLTTRKGMRIAIHEMLHASNWAATEKVVDRVSTDISNCLWRLGYRRNKR